jgi:hypothetical protein
VREEGGRVREGERDKKKEKLCLDIMKTNEENIGAQESAQTEYIPVHSGQRELSITLFFHPASFPMRYFTVDIWHIATTCLRLGCPRNTSRVFHWGSHPKRQW